MKKIHKLIKIIIFTVFLIIMVLKLEKILSNPIGTHWAEQTGMAGSVTHKEAYDVCFLGTSMVVANICNQELYEKYGIAGVSIGEAEQPIYLSRYTLEDFLEYQSPQVVFLDTRALFYSDDWVKKLTVKLEGYIVHTSLNALSSPIIKMKALQDVEQYKETRDEQWSYYSNLYYSHENWKRITDRNFKGYKISDCMNGNISLFGIYEQGENIYDASSMDTIYTIDEKAEKYFSDMVDICKKANTTFVLITSYTDFDKPRHRAASELAQKYQVQYIDINEHIEDIGFSHKMDLNDGGHFNLFGAIKWTDYLGEYLTQNYDFPDRRNDRFYDWYKKQSEVFDQQKKIIATKWELLSAVTFDEYLAALKELNHYENAIFISVYDEASNCLTETERILLQDLGLCYDLMGKYRYSYAAAVYGNIVEEDISSDETVMIEGNIDGLKYKVVSDRLTVGVSDASISINGKEHMQKGRGFNIVVYNTELNQVISSAYFDTCAFANPSQSRFTTETVNQHEIAPNVWETER